MTKQTHCGCRKLCNFCLFYLVGLAKIDCSCNRLKSFELIIFYFLFSTESYQSLIYLRGKRETDNIFVDKNEPVYLLGQQFSSLPGLPSPKSSLPSSGDTVEARSFLRTILYASPHGSVSRSLL